MNQYHIGPCPPACIKSIQCGKCDEAFGKHVFEAALRNVTQNFRVATVSGCVNSRKPHCSWRIYYQYANAYVGRNYEKGKDAKQYFNEILLGIPQGLEVKLKQVLPSSDSYIVELASRVSCTNCPKPDFDFLKTNPNTGEAEKCIKESEADELNGILVSLEITGATVSDICKTTYEEITKIGEQKNIQATDLSEASREAVEEKLGATDGQ